MSDVIRSTLDEAFRPGLTRRDVIGGIAGAGSLALASGRARAQSQGPIVLTMFGGVVEKAFRTALIEPFEQDTGIKVIPKLGTPGEWLTNALVNRRKPEIDLLWLAFPESTRAVMEDIVVELSKERVPNLNKVRPIWIEMFDGKGVAHEYGTFGLAYRTDLVKEPPKSWVDLWSEKYAGQIAVPDVNSTGSWELLMMATKLNGGTEADLEPGIQAIKRLKPSVKRFFKNLTEAANLVDAGEAAIVGPITDFRAYALQDAGKPVRFVLPSEGSMPSLVSFHIAKNSPHQEACEKFINFALSEAGLSGFCNQLSCGVPRPDIQLNPTVQSRLAPFESLAIFDWRKVVPRIRQYTERWNREISR